MNTIDEVLNHYGLTLDECDDQWRETVEEFRRVESAMPKHIAASREKEIADSFLNFHTVVENEPDKPAEDTTKKSKPAGHKPAKGSKAKVQPFTYNEAEVFKKADEMLDDLL